MIPVGVPPAVVVFEDSIVTDKRNEMISRYKLDFVPCSLGGMSQVQVLDDVATTVQVNPATGRAELRSVHTSLRKKAHERTTEFERNFVW